MQVGSFHENLLKASNSSSFIISNLFSDKGTFFVHSFTFQRFLRLVSRLVSGFHYKRVIFEQNFGGINNNSLIGMDTYELF